MNLFIDTNHDHRASVSQPDGKLLDRVTGVFNNFISQITNWVKINSGVSPYNNATSGACRLPGGHVRRLGNILYGPGARGRE